MLRLLPFELGLFWWFTDNLVDLPTMLSGPGSKRIASCFCGCPDEEIPELFTTDNTTSFCNSVGGTGCEITISAGQTIVDLEHTSYALTSGQTIILTLSNSGSENLVKLGSSTTHTLTVQ